jgi:hypothetical protein
VIVGTNKRRDWKWKPFYALLLYATCAPLSAERHELGLTLGRVFANDDSGAIGRIKVKSGMALQANYGVRIAQFDAFALLGEVHLLASPLRELDTSLANLTRDFATLYVTPGLRVKFAPDARISPYFAVGGGYALYEQSTMTTGDEPNTAPRHTHRGVVDFGGGIDVFLLRWLGLRFEARDFYSGKPSLNVRTPGSGQHNVVAGGGVVLRF